MKEKLAKVLTRLATDEKYAETFKADRKGLLKKEGLDDKHIKMVLENDIDGVRSVLGSEYDVHPNDIIRAFKK